MMFHQKVNVIGSKKEHHIYFPYLDSYLFVISIFLLGRCTVCLAEYHAEDTLRILPFCGHAFHAPCIDIWLQQHSTCPVCRISLREPDKRRLMQPMFSSAVRSQYPMNSLDTNSYQRLLTVHGLSSRAHDNHQMDPIEEDQFQAAGNGAEAGESNSILIEASQTTKDLGNKRVESPSNPQINLFCIIQAALFQTIRMIRADKICCCFFPLMYIQQNDFLFSSPILFQSLPDRIQLLSLSMCVCVLKPFWFNIRSWFVGIFVQ